MEIYKTLMKQIEEDTNKWKDILWSWIGRVNIVKKHLYYTKPSINSIPIKILKAFLQKFFKNPKFCMEQQKGLRAKVILIYLKEMKSLPYFLWHCLQ